MAHVQAVAPQLVAPGVTLYLGPGTFLYGGQYRPGQSVSFQTADAAYAFLNNAPECVTTNIAYPYYGGGIVTVYPSNGCYGPVPLPPRPPCPCAQGY